MASKALSEDALRQVSQVFLNVAKHMVCMYVCMSRVPYINYSIQDLPEQPVTLLLTFLTKDPVQF
jgi:hypothetical protein